MVTAHMRRLVIDENLHATKRNIRSNGHHNIFWLSWMQKRTSLPQWAELFDLNSEGSYGGIQSKANSFSTSDSAEDPSMISKYHQRIDGRRSDLAHLWHCLLSKSAIKIESENDCDAHDLQRPNLWRNTWTELIPTSSAQIRRRPQHDPKNDRFFALFKIPNSTPRAVDMLPATVGTMWTPQTSQFSQNTDLQQLIYNCCCNLRTDLRLNAAYHFAAFTVILILHFINLQTFRLHWSSSKIHEWPLACHRNLRKWCGLRHYKL